MSAALLPWLPSGGPGAPRIAVLGAGISGLVAAHELKGLGLPVTVFERAGRVGGRIETFQFPGTDHLGELGAMRIPGSHTHTLRYISKLGLDGRLARFTSLFRNRNGLVALDDLPPPPWELRAPELPGDGAMELVARTVMYKLQVVINAMSPGELRDAFQVYAEGAMSSDLLTLLRTQVPPARYWFLLNASVGVLIAWFVRLQEQLAPSLRIFLRDIAWEISEDLYYLKGGMRQLPEKLAEGLTGELRLHCELERILSHDDFVELVLHDRRRGTSWKERFDYVLCTLPVPVLRTLTLEGFGAWKTEALRQARYASASKVLFLCRRRFWEQRPYAISSGASYVGGLTRQVYYSDLGLDAAPSQSGRGGVLLASYALGAESEKLAGLPDDELAALVTSNLRRIHPEIAEPGMVEAFKVRHWQKEAGTLGGCSVTWPLYYPGVGGEEDVTRLWEDVARPDKRVYFAGEHCSQERAWIEGAVASSLRAVSGLVERVTGDQAGSTASGGGPSAAKAPAA
jgi:monoamine oxidase